MGKLTISMAMFKSFLYVYQRVDAYWINGVPTIYKAIKPNGLIFREYHQKIWHVAPF
jgi:hypothetical protein